MRPAPSLSRCCNSLSDFTQRQNAQVKQFLVNLINPLRDTGLGFDADKLRNAVRIEQESAHNGTSRPRSLSRSSQLQAYQRELTEELYDAGRLRLSEPSLGGFHLPVAGI